MQCLVCGAEMHAGQALGDDCLPGFEHRTFTCSVCGDVERRLILKSHAGRTDADPVLFPDAPPTPPPATIPPISLSRHVRTDADPVLFPDAPPTPPPATIPPISLSRHVRTDADPVLFRDAPPTSPPATIPPISSPATMENEGAAASAFVRRLFAKLDSIRGLIRRRKASTFTSDSANPQEWAHTAEHVPEELVEPIPEVTPGPLDEIRPETVPAVPPVSMPVQTDKDKDECEFLLRSAIEVVQSATRSSQKKTPLTELSSPCTSDFAKPQEWTPTAEHVPEAPLEPIPEVTPASLDEIRPETVPAAPPVFMSAQTDKNKDECENLLRSPIEMVQSATRSSRKKAALTELSSASLTSAPVLVQTSPLSVEEKSPAVVQTKSIPAVRKSPVIVVQIYHDAQKAKYVARDIKSGLGVLRHENRARLQEMCDRLGWQIVDKEIERRKLGMGNKPGGIV